VRNRVLCDADRHDVDVGDPAHHTNDVRVPLTAIIEDCPWV